MPIVISVTLNFSCFMVYYGCHDREVGVSMDWRKISNHFACLVLCSSAYCFRYMYSYSLLHQLTKIRQAYIRSMYSYIMNPVIKFIHLIIYILLVCIFRYRTKSAIKHYQKSEQSANLSCWICSNPPCPMNSLSYVTCPEPQSCFDPKNRKSPSTMIQ